MNPGKVIVHEIEAGGILFAELELMDDQELLSEMLSVCLSIAFLGKLYGPELHLDGIRYARVIERVSRKQHSGKSPS